MPAGIRAPEILATPVCHYPRRDIPFSVRSAAIPPVLVSNSTHQPTLPALCRLLLRQRLWRVCSTAPESSILWQQNRQFNSARKRPTRCDRCSPHSLDQRRKQALLNWLIFLVNFSGFAAKEYSAPGI